ncbi:hypothetical protein [Halobacillus litoralis]|uniref:DUF4747 domain-containing protein n=1 Tax=Halobacillus litoralis TaxID=45668 RepID=A0A410MIC3_9BACI|nr:hypothetical protein [Halobacillus litoralis]QAS54440.1 hypothetical protein HLI_20565 [Halobacillus litoralis]
MSKTLYFSKVNINSHILRVYEDKKEFERVIKELYVKIKDDVEYVSEAIQMDDEGNPYTHKEIYKFKSIEKYKDELDFTITGKVFKTMTIFIGEENGETGEIKKIPAEHTEGIEFYYDLYKEIITFNTTSRFGYVKFNDVFKKLLNKCMSTKNERYYFEVSLLREGLNVNEIKKQLKSIGELETLRIEIMPPNPDDELLDSIQSNGEEYLDSYKDGNVTQRSILFTSRAPEGLNVDSSMIDNEIEQLDKIHSKLSSDEATLKGYVNVEATNKSGRFYTTNDSKPVKDKIEKPSGLLDFAKECRSKINALVSNIL